MSSNTTHDDHDADMKEEGAFCDTCDSMVEDGTCLCGRTRTRDTSDGAGGGEDTAAAPSRGGETSAETGDPGATPGEADVGSAAPQPETWRGECPDCGWKLTSNYLADNNVVKAPVDCEGCGRELTTDVMEPLFTAAQLAAVLDHLEEEYKDELSRMTVAEIFQRVRDELAAAGDAD